MTRTAEASLVGGACLLAVLGVTLVNLAKGGTVDTQAALTGLVFAITFGGLLIAVRALAPSSSPHLLPLVALLAAIGFTEVYRLGSERAGQQRWWWLIAFGLATVTLMVLRRSGLALLRRYRYLLFAFALGLMLLPMLPTSSGLPLRGWEANGSRLWVLLDLGFTELHFQPGELAKLAFVIFLASYLAERGSSLTAGRQVGSFHFPEPRQLVPILLVWGGSLFILIAQRDLGASLLLFAVFVIMLYAATGRAVYLGVGAVLFAGGALAAWRIFDHVQVRVDAWLHPFTNYDGAGYQIAQGVFALGTGSLSGAGPGLGRPDLIPNAHTDFIFAAIGEELGLAGSVAVLVGFALLVGVGFGIALRSRDRFRKLLATGLATVLAVQTLLIVGGVLRLFPLTGITLPFMSYGGSALVGNLLAVVLLAQISHEERV